MCIMVLAVGCSSEGDKALMRGVLTENTFSSEFLGVSFEAPVGWIYATDEEIADMMGMTAELLSDSGLNFSKKALERQSIYDMSVDDPKTFSSVIVCYENLSMVLGGTRYTEEQYLDTLAKQLQVLGMGYQSVGEVYNQNLGTVEFSVMQFDIPEFKTSQYYFVRKTGKYMSCIIITVFPGATLEEILAYFS